MQFSHGTSREQNAACSGLFLVESQGMLPWRVKRKSLGEVADLHRQPPQSTEQLIRISMHEIVQA